MSQFIESIRIKNGKIDLLDYHNERFNETRKLFFCVDKSIDLRPFIQIPKEFNNGLVKCRILYDLDVRKVQFSFYKPQKIESLKLVNASINYAYKSTDRTELEQLKNSASPADEVLIVNKGMISDTSFSNIIFRKNGDWFTPDSPLLAGVRREYLLNEGVIEELPISPDDLVDFDAFMLINAMLPFDESKIISIQNILKL